jgi:hypothetical protein
LLHIFPRWHCNAINILSSALKLTQWEAIQMLYAFLVYIVTVPCKGKVVPVLN